MTLSEAAARYIGQKELLNNVFKDDTELGKKLHEAGQKDGNAWCAFLMEVCAKDAYPEKRAEWDKLFSGSAVQTFRNFENAAYVTGYLPAANWLVCWQKYEGGKPHWSGHIGVVESVNADGSFNTIEGNTNAEGSREGNQVARRIRRVIPDVQNGLRVIGFVKIA